jgi:hypothetical protein
VSQITPIVTRKLLAELRELSKNATQVVGWYPHPAEVRGPFCRWLTVSEVAPEYEKNVASRADDAKYAAAAMNSIPALLDYIERLEGLLAVEDMLRE